MSSASFSFTNTIPAANNSPSNDQPLMLINNQSTASLLAIDHIGFNASFGGNHAQVHLPQYAATPTVVSSAATQGSLIYSGSTTITQQADQAHAQCYFMNANSVSFLLSAIRAFGSFLFNASNTTIINGFNFTLSVDSSGTFATITLTANVTTSNTYTVIPFYNGPGSQAIITVISPGQFTLTPNTVVPDRVCSFIVLQI